MHLEQGLLNKVAMFCNVDPTCVIQSEDLPSIYEVPLNMQRQGLDRAILAKVGMASHAPALQEWERFVERERSLSTSVTVGLVGKYDLQDAYKSIRESLHISGVHAGKKVAIRFVNSETVDAKNVSAALDGLDGVVICPGFGQRGIQGKIEAVRYAREHDLPAFGICLGMQMMVIEFARDVLGLADADSAEMNPETAHNVIDMMEDQKKLTQLGGTMRLGAYGCDLTEGSRVQAIYGKAHIAERHRHRYEFNNRYRDAFEQAGMHCVGVNPDSGLVEIVEIPGLRWFIGTQFHPEYSTTVLSPHPLFLDFVKTL
jgi:CTP synthase